MVVLSQKVCLSGQAIVIVPKKSAPGEPPKRRLCVDFRKVNELKKRS